MLVHFSDILRQNAEEAFVARYGGEEFAVLLPEISKEQAGEIAEKIRTRVQDIASRLKHSLKSRAIS